MFENLSKYIDLLEREGELRRVAARVSAELEIAEITDRFSKSSGGGPALFFENVAGSAFPVVTNLFGSERRMAMALGAGSLDEISELLDGLLREALAPRGSLAEKMRTVPLLAEASRWFPRRVSGRGECQRVVTRGEDVRLSELPVLKCWPHDGGRFVTLPLVHTADPATGAGNVGMYRMQIFDERTTGMHWHIHKTGARHYEAYRRAGIRRMPVSVCLGGDPAYTYAATAPMPEGMDEYLLAGFLRRRAVRLVRCVTNGLWVPADCDFVIEGWVDTSEPPRREGPFGDHTGFYSLEDDYPAFHVEAVTHRRGAVWPATLVGIPPQEDAWLAAATERIFLPPIRRALQPEVRDIHMPPAGVAHNLAIVAMETAYAGQTEKVAAALWGAGQMMFNKVLVAAPADFPIRDTEAVMALLRGVRPECDLVFGRGVADVLDHAMARTGIGSKLLIDATDMAADAREHRAVEGVCADLTTDARTHVAVEGVCTDLVADAREYSVDVGETANARTRGTVGDARPAENFRALFDPAAEGLNPYEKLWLGLANIDPARDITVANGVATIDCRAKIKNRGNANGVDSDDGIAHDGAASGVDSGDISPHGNAAKGGDMPRRWPNVTVMDETTEALVDTRWAEYDLGEPLPSPSARYRRLLLSDGAEV